MIARVSSGRAPSALPVEYPTTTGERGSDIESMKRARPFVSAVHIANSVATHGGTDVTRGAQSGKQPTRRILRDDTWLRLVSYYELPS